MEQNSFDAIVIGGGFYGSSLAIYLKKYFKNIALLEKEAKLMTRASYTNQARVHNGYHYPRSYLTASRSHTNYKKFLKDYASCINEKFTNIYAVAKNNSYISTNKFQDFCKEAKLPLKQAASDIKNIFNNEAIEDSFISKEAVFNTQLIKGKLMREIDAQNISVFFNADVVKVSAQENNTLAVHLQNGTVMSAKYVFNCTYGQINNILKKSGLPLLPFKYELTELALLEAPPQLKNVGITVIDGPFFSFLPFPDKSLHTLSHVSYTPHAYKLYNNQKLLHLLSQKNIVSKYMYMLKDAQRFVPLLKDAKYIQSLYEVKTVLVTNENDDGRPILLRRDYGFRNFYIIMGGKIDNIYDVYSALDKDFQHS